MILLSKGHQPETGYDRTGAQRNALSVEAIMDAVSFRCAAERA